MENAHNQPSVYASKPWQQRYDYWVPTEITLPTQPINFALNHSATMFPDQPATAFLGVKLTFRELKQHADKLATALSQLGIGKGDRVGVMLPNCPQYVISFFAITRLSAIVANINPIYTPREVELVAKDSGMRAIIVLDALAPVVLGVLAHTNIEQVITTSLLSYSANPTSAPDVPEGTLSFSELIVSVATPKLPRVDIDAKEDLFSVSSKPDRSTAE